MTIANGDLIYNRISQVGTLRIIPNEEHTITGVISF